MLNKTITLALISMALCFSLPAHAQRKIPADAKRATFAAADFPLVRLNGVIFRLAPGARIYTENNLTSIPASAPQNVEVKYQINALGSVQTIWILTPQERAAP